MNKNKKRGNYIYVGIFIMISGIITYILFPSTESFEGIGGLGQFITGLQIILYELFGRFFACLIIFIIGLTIFIFNLNLLKKSKN